MLKTILNKLISFEDSHKLIAERLDNITGKLETLQADALLVDPMAQFGAAAQKVDSQEKQTKED